MKKTKRIVAMLLAVIMVFSLLPVTAFAADEKDLGKITGTCNQTGDALTFSFSNLKACRVSNSSLSYGGETMSVRISSNSGQLTLKCNDSGFTAFPPGDYELQISQMRCTPNKGETFTLYNYVLLFSLDESGNVIISKKFGLKYDSYKDGVITFTVPDEYKSVAVAGDITVAYAGETSAATTVTADQALCTVKDNTIAFRVKNNDGTALAGISDYRGSYTVQFAKLTLVTQEGETVTGKKCEAEYCIALDGSFCAGPFVPFSGSGTSDDPYLIGVLWQLECLAKLVNAGNTKYDEAQYKLTADISGLTTPIGGWPNSFNGTFDGAGHTITLNMNVSSDYAGIFGYSCYGTIKNLIVAGTLTSSANYVGGICGDAQGSFIINCINNAAITGPYAVGGICGYLSGSNIENCINNASITGGDIVGGICGLATDWNKGSSIINCSNNASITGGNGVGGIGGECNRTVVENCVNNGIATGTSQIGGICSYADNSSLKYCINNAKAGGASTAGILSKNNNSSCSIDSCYYDSSFYSDNGYGTPYSTALMKAPSGTDGALIDLANAWAGDNYLPWVIGKDGYPALKYSPPHFLVYSAEGNVLTAACNHSDCDLKTIKVTLTAKDASAGSAYPGAMLNLNDATEAGLTAGEITYYAKGSSDQIAAPSEAGQYTAKVTLRDGSNTDYTLEDDFSLVGGFAGAYLTIENDISVNFVVEKAGYGDSLPTVTYTVGGGESQDATMLDANTDDTYYVFRLDALNPAQLGVKIEATLNWKGEKVDEHTYSIADYCFNKLNGQTVKTAFTTLLVDLLNYGAEAQKYLGKTDNLCNAGLSPEQQAFATSDEDFAAPDESKAFKPKDNIWTDNTLVLGATVAIRCYFNTPEGATKVLVDNDDDLTNGNIGEITAFGSDTNGTYADFTGLPAANMRDVPRFVLCDKDGNAISQTLYYSIEAYAAEALAGSDETVKPLVTAMMIYGDSANAYWTAKNSK